MPTFKPYAEVVEPFVLPIGERNYTIPPFTTGGRRRWEDVQKPGADPLSDDEFEHLFLGDVADEMRADNVPAVAFDRALQAAFAYAVAGRDAAEIMWETGGRPAAIEEYVREHKPKEVTPDGR